MQRQRRRQRFSNDNWGVAIGLVPPVRLFSITSNYQVQEHSFGDQGVAAMTRRQGWVLVSVLPKSYVLNLIECY